MDVSSKSRSRVAVVMGGRSSERDVSLVTGEECATALENEGFEIIRIDAGADLAGRLLDAKPDCVFNALHGRFGEDGVVQGLFEWLDLPYTHSGVLASALAMDKTRSKEIFQKNGLPIAESVIINKSDLEAGHPIAPPYVLKPNNEGSSVGILIVPAHAEKPPEPLPDMPDELMAEAFLPGKELTTTVLGDQALAVTEIITKGWYDYEAKYEEGGSKHLIPAPIPDEITEACKKYALVAHHALGCSSISRTDFRWDETKGLDGLALLETNTQPGMTPTSLTPEQARHCDIDFGSLCKKLVEDASCDR